MFRAIAVTVNDRVNRRPHLRVSAAALLLVLAGAGCGGSPAAPSANVPFSQTDIRVGTGADAVNGARLTVHYTGWLYAAGQPENKGRQFDSSAGGAPFVFTLGVRSVIGGWDLGVPGMKVGGVRRLVIPPELGYGSTGAGNGVIPPNATLVFDVELLNVQS